MKYFNYLEAPYNREKNVGLSYATMLYLQTICNFIDWMLLESTDYFNDNVKGIMSGQVKEYDPAKSEYIDRIIDDVRYLFEFYEDDVEALKIYNEKAYDLLWRIYADICNSDIDHIQSFEELVQLRKELAKTEF